MLAAIDRAMPWAEDAACLGSGAVWVLEPTQELQAPKTVYDKLLLCAGCPVRRECLRFALTADFDAYGVWGGTTGIERRTLRPRAGDRIDYQSRAVVDVTIDILEATRPARLALWRRLTAEAKGAHRNQYRAERHRITGPLKAAVKASQKALTAART